MKSMSEICISLSSTIFFESNQTMLALKFFILSFSGFHGYDVFQYSRGWVNGRRKMPFKSKQITLSFSSIVYPESYPKQQIISIEVQFYEAQSCVIHRSGAIHASHSGMWSTYGSYELPNMNIHFCTHMLFWRWNLFIWKKRRLYFGPTPPNKFCGNHRTYFFSSLDTKLNTITKLIDYW